MKFSAGASFLLWTIFTSPCAHSEPLIGDLFVKTNACAKLFGFQDLAPPEVPANQSRDPNGTYVANEPNISHWWGWVRNALNKFAENIAEQFFENNERFTLLRLDPQVRKVLGKQIKYIVPARDYKDPNHFLHLWVFKKPGHGYANRTVVLLHAVGDGKHKQIQHALMYRKLGFNVVLADLTSHGMSSAYSKKEKKFTDRNYGERYQQDIQSIFDFMEVVVPELYNTEMNLHAFSVSGFMAQGILPVYNGKLKRIIIDDGGGISLPQSFANFYDNIAFDRIPLALRWFLRKKDRDNPNGWVYTGLGNTVRDLAVYKMFQALRIEEWPLRSFKNLEQVETILYLIGTEQDPVIRNPGMMAGFAMNSEVWARTHLIPLTNGVHLQGLKENTDEYMRAIAQAYGIRLNEIPDSPGSYREIEDFKVIYKRYRDTIAAQVKGTSLKFTREEEAQIKAALDAAEAMTPEEESLLR